MTKKEYIVRVVRCAASNVMYEKSCSGCDEEFLCRKIQTLLRERSHIKNPCQLRK